MAEFMAIGDGRWKKDCSDNECANVYIVEGKDWDDARKHLLRYFSSNRCNVDYLDPRCKECSSHRVAMGVGGRISNGRTRDGMLKAQEGKCAICSKEITFSKGRGGAAVDHNHQTGIIRGILCTRCNNGLGYIEHEEEWLPKALAYLDQHK